MSARRGHVVGAFYREDLRPIDLSYKPERILDKEFSFLAPALACWACAGA